MRGYSQSFHVFSYCVVKYSILGRYVFWANELCEIN
jgi:hypothetical protein